MTTASFSNTNGVLSWQTTKATKVTLNGIEVLPNGRAFATAAATYTLVVYGGTKPITISHAVSRWPLPTCLTLPLRGQTNTHSAPFRKLRLPRRCPYQHPPQLRYLHPRRCRPCSR